MSAEDKKIQYIIEAIDRTDEGIKESASNINKLRNATITLQNASDARIRSTIEALRKERSEVQEVTTKINTMSDAHRRNNAVAKTSLSQQFDYSRRLSTQFNEVATRILGIGGAYATFRYLVNSLKDAGLNTEKFQSNLDKVSATIGTELLPLAENGMKWFNENYQVITQTVLNFGKTFSIVFNGLASLPVGAAAAFYKLRPIIDSALGIRGPALEKSKREAETLGKSFVESFKAEISKIQDTIGSMSELPKMSTPKSNGKDKNQSFGDYTSSIGLSQMNIDAAIKQAEEQQAASKASQDKIAEYIKKTSEETLKDAEEKGQKWQELQTALAESNASAKGTELEQQYAQLELWKTKELELYAGINDSKTAIDKMYDNKKAEIEKTAAERAKTIADKEKQMKIQNFQQVGGAFNDLMGAIGQATKENAKAQKAIAIVQAIINTALGVTQAIAQGGVAGIVTGALVAATGAIQIATIASQNFALGGVAQRNPGAVSDSVNVNVNPDERIVTKRQQNNLTRFLNNPDSSSGRGDTYNIFDYSGNLVETLITQIQNGQADRLSRTLNSRFATA